MNRFAWIPVLPIALMLTSGCGGSEDTAVAVVRSSDDAQQSLRTDMGALKMGESLQSDASSVVGAPRVGECARIQGPADVATIDYGQCGDIRMTYRVVQVVGKPTGCATDVNRRYYSSDGRGNSFTACLDYNWSLGNCIFVSEHTVTSGSCASGGNGRKLKTRGYFTDARPVGDCPSQTGVVYPVQGVTVCQEDVE